MSYRSWTINLRTNIGICESHVKAFDKWIKKQEFGAYCFEKIGTERHIHAQIWLKEARPRGNVVKPIRKHILNNYEPEEYCFGVCDKVRFAYNDEFVEQYMVKENKLEYCQIPPDHDRHNFYPDEDEQDRAQAKAKSKNIWLLDLDELWKHHATAEEKSLPDIFNVAKFMERICFLDLWRINKDGKIRLAECRIFQRWLTKNSNGNLFLSKVEIEMKELLEGKREKGKENQE